jgi:predicted DNA-binding transcriptional regulator AlpA
MTPAEVAVWLHLKPRQLERFGVPSLKLGHKTVRYIKADVLAWLTSQKTARTG